MSSKLGLKAYKYFNIDSIREYRRKIRERKYREQMEIENKYLRHNHHIHYSVNNIRQTNKTENTDDLRQDIINGLNDTNLYEEKHSSLLNIYDDH
jgi:hypothetical protein